MDNINQLFKKSIKYLTDIEVQLRDGSSKVVLTHQDQIKIESVCQLLAGCRLIVLSDMKDPVYLIYKDSALCNCTSPTFLPDENQHEPGYKCEYCCAIDKQIETSFPGKEIFHIRDITNQSPINGDNDSVKDDLPF